MRRSPAELIKLGVFAGPTGDEPVDEMDLIAHQSALDTLALLDAEGYALVVKPGEPGEGASLVLAAALCDGPDGEDWFAAQREAARVMEDLTEVGYQLVPGRTASIEEPTDVVELMARLTSLYEAARADGRGLDALDIVAARDAVERLEALMIEIRAHRFDTQHIHDKGVYPRIRLADQMLYEAAGLDRVTEDDPRCKNVGSLGDGVRGFVVCEKQAGHADDLYHLQGEWRWMTGEVAERWGDSRGDLPVRRRTLLDEVDAELVRLGDGVAQEHAEDGDE